MCHSMFSPKKLPKSRHFDIVVVRGGVILTFNTRPRTRFNGVSSHLGQEVGSLQSLPSSSIVQQRIDL